MLTYGQDVELKMIKPSLKLMIIGERLADLADATYRLESMPIEEATMRSENFMRNNFHLHKVPYVDEEEINDKLSKTELEKEADLLKILPDCYAMRDSYELPRNLIYEDYRTGELEEMFFDTLEEKEVLRKVPVLFTGINLSFNTTDLTIGSISHEITHSQINSIKGSCKSFYNNEVLSIFLQLLALREYDEDSAEIERSFRLLDIPDLIEFLSTTGQGKTSSDPSDSIEASRYLESTIKALDLYECYLKLSQAGRTNMLNDINRILKGEKTVEDLLNKHDITLRESIKKLEKKYL